MSFENIIPTVRNPAEDKREIRNAFERVSNGRSNAGGSVTLTTSSTTTTVTDDKVASDTRIVLFPTTSNGASEVATTYVSSKADGSFVVTHLSNAVADRTFDYIIQG